jgi:cytochrome P450
VSDFESVDYFTDQSLVPNPYPYFDYLRSQCPLRPATPHGVVAVTGHAEALAAHKDPAFSSCVAVAGPFPPLPFTPEGNDITDLIAEHRGTIPMAEHVVTMDAQDHAKTRGLLSKLITPKRLSENEEFIWHLVDQQIDKFLDRGSCEFMEDFAKPLSMLVIAYRVRTCPVSGQLKRTHNVAMPKIFLPADFAVTMTTPERVSGSKDLTLPPNSISQPSLADTIAGADKRTA